MKSSSFGRSVELMKLMAKVGMKELRSKDLKSRIEQAVLIGNSLSNLKGAAMKAGQLLSLDLNNYFPPEAIAVLSQLQDAATAHPIEEMKAVIDKELPEKKSKIKELSDKPIGVASIGQVHTAKYEDQEIVLKIQYPRVAESIDSDLKILKTLATSFCQLTGRKMDLGPLFAEFKSILVQEVDYEAEAEFQKQYGLNVSKLTPKNGVKYRVPKVYEDISTKKILPSSYEPGISLRSWISTNPDMEKREALAYAILDLYFHEFFEWGLVQTDPNWGNFLINEKENELGLVLLDFGATRRYEKEFIKNYIQLLNLAANRDFAKLKKHAIQFKMIDERESEEAFKAFEDVIMTAIKPFFAGHDSNHFDFTDKNHSVESQNATKILSDELVYSPPPYAIIFLHRKLAGVYSILKGLGVKLDISSYWQQMTKLSNINK